MPQFILVYIFIAFIFLLIGLFLPMLNIDARISSLQFKLLGENLTFTDQILYYKSKSIMEMAMILLSQSQIKIILVGVLVLVFSILFPITKLISSIYKLYKPKTKNKLMDFMIYKSGKWSMADVFVVAVFMSYIGFSGIISDQLSQLEKIKGQLNIFTTNHSELQHGFFFFSGFVLLSILISQTIKNLENTKK